MKLGEHNINIYSNIARFDLVFHDLAIRTAELSSQIRSVLRISTQELACELPLMKCSSSSSSSSRFLLSLEIISLSVWSNYRFSCWVCSLLRVSVISYEHPGNLVQDGAADRIMGHMSVINNCVIKNMTALRG